MQLFSIGLWKLNPDGTGILDGEGNPIPTYSNDNIVEFARIWTGFRERPIRGNTEVKRISLSNQIDPMVVLPERRDAFPKMDIHRGYIGDAYPLCAELGPRAFLRRGASYRFLGRSGVPEHGSGRDHWDFAGELSKPTQPFFAPDPASSALYARLCNRGPSQGPAAGRCRFEPVITLESNLECDGAECELHTLRVVKVVVDGTNYFYECAPIAAWQPQR